ncbi:MAG: hypothetical protein JO157_01460, partial [Acetobacteraceae bacterium]|nr:hypothetical protein [Acetobacteraceae bacterium]
MSRGLRYVKVHRNPDSSLIYLNPTQVFGASWRDGTWNQPRPAPAPVRVEAPAPAAPVVLDPASELRNAEAAMIEAVRGYGFACKRLGEANRTHTAALRTPSGQVYAPPSLPIRPEVVREARRCAFRDLNRSRARMLAARRRLDAARLALGLPLADTDAKLAMASV